MEGGEGSKVSLWEDLWVGDQPLAFTFLRKFRFSNSVNAKISELDWGRKLGFKRNFERVNWRRF